MEIKSLFNPERRRDLLKSVREGKRLFAGKGQAEPPSPAFKDAPLMKITSQYVFASNPPLIEAGSRRYTPNEFLILAIEFCDLDAVKFSVSLRADVNYRFNELPIHPGCTEENPTKLFCGQRTPLQYAKFGMLNPRTDIIEFLKQHGAKD